jgi:NAD(P)-dependent dehydrogenase (short-subunit alcohol dehydrogenase family)
MKTAIITGAYRGLGFEVARQLSKKGFHVILTARRAKKGKAAAAKLKNASFVELDVTDPVSVGQAASQIEAVDILINNAAILIDGDEDVTRISPDRVLETLTTNSVGALRVSQAFIPQLTKSEAGRIINVSSGGGQLNGDSTRAPAYCISKAALNMVTCQLANVLKPAGIAVNSVCPGWCRTEMGGSDADRSPEEGAAGIVWLATEAPQDQTGLFWRDGQVIPW